MQIPELPREEVLVRLYELQHQLELYDVERWLNAEERGNGQCEDCAHHRPVRRLNNVIVCEYCGLSRIRVASQLEAATIARMGG